MSGLGPFVACEKIFLNYAWSGEPATVSKYDFAFVRRHALSARNLPIALSFAPSSRPIRVYIIDPQPLIAAALHYLFAANAPFDVVGTAQSVKPLALRSASPDVILLCQEHGSTAIDDLVGECAMAAPAAKICVVACHAHPESAPRILGAGAVGYAVKDTGPGELIEAVIQISSGTRYVDPRIERGAPEPSPAGHRARTVNPLSARETEVLKLIAGGYSNREISIALSLSEKTIKNHISHIFAKLHITARTQAVIHAIKTGIA